MIKFFRNIRQRLVIDPQKRNASVTTRQHHSGGRAGNRFTKYFLYAIGEIILVVIGILIALQINNNNELIKTNNRQNTYLSLIKNEMENNLNSLKEEREILANTIANLQTILELMQQEFVIDTIPENMLSKILVDAISNDISVNYENGVLTELIVSGNLKDIRNDSIRSKLSSWESKIYKIREQENSLRNYWDKSNDFFELNGKFRTLFDHTTYSDYVELKRLSATDSNKSVLDSTIFENILLIKLASSMHLQKGVYPRYETELEALITMIDKELVEN
jgi:Family of unknown function (DUF6090)